MRLNMRKKTGENLTECTHCGYVYDKTSVEFYQIDGQIICAHCYANATRTCKDCGTITLRYVRASCGYSHVDFLCSKCAENYTLCYNCGSRFRTETMHEYDGDYYCNECYENCSHDCFGCGDRMMNSNSFCDSCYNIWNNNVYPYDYKPSKKKFCKIDSKIDSNESNVESKLYFGLEVELEFTSQKSASIVAQLNEQFGDFIYLKHDGSLNNGVEIVTHPCTYRYHMQVFPWEKLCKFMNDNSLMANDTCGLHIHFSKKYMHMVGKHYDASNLKKIDYFFHKHKDFIIKVSGRTSESYARFKKERSAMTLSQCTGHHSAINFENVATVEVRTFASSTDYLHILSYIDFLNILIQYIRNNNFNTISKIENFHSYCVKNIEKCPFFIEKFDKILDEAKIEEKKRLKQPKFKDLKEGEVICTLSPRDQMISYSQMIPFPQMADLYEDEIDAYPACDPCDLYIFDGIGLNGPLF